MRKVLRMTVIACCLALLWCSVAGAADSAGVAINEANFPDEIFREYVSTNFDTDSSDTLSDEEINAVTVIGVYDSGISSLKGIEYFTALTELYCGRNNLTELDVSKNTELRELLCNYSHLTALDVSSNTALVELDIGSNDVRALDVSNNLALESLVFGQNQLTELDVSNNTYLSYLDCSENRLAALDVSSNTALYDIACFSQDITISSLTDTSDPSYPNGLGLSLDVSRVSGLTATDGTGGTVATSTEDGTIRFASRPATITYNYDTGNVSGDTIYMDVTVTVATRVSNEGTAIDEEHFPDATFRQYISSNFDDGDGILNWSEIEQIKRIDINEQGITSLQGIEYLTSVTVLWCRSNDIASLDLSNNSALTEIYCYNNALTELDVSGLASLKALECWGNPLTSLNVDGCTALETLKFYQTQVREINLATNTALSWLECYHTALTELDVSTNTALTELWCGENDITALDLKNNTALTYLWCSTSRLTSIDISSNRALVSFDCSFNAITDLDISNNTNLVYLKVEGNQLTALDAGNNTALASLEGQSQTFTTEKLYYIRNRSYPYRLNLIDLNSSIEPNHVTITDASVPYNRESNMIYFSSLPDNIIYQYDTQGPDELGVTVTISSDGTPEVVLELNSANFPDNAFRSYLAANFDTDGDLELSRSEILNITDISIDSSDVRSLSGIEEFTALTSLTCRNNSLETIDVSGLSGLVSLDCSYNALTELDIASLDKLVYLNCSHNLLTGLDATGCKALLTLDCSNNSLETLNANDSKNLLYLYCSDNNLTRLNAESCVYLIVLDCHNNRLAELNAHNCYSLEELYCYNNQLSSLSVTGDYSLYYIDGHNNLLADIDLSRSQAVEELDLSSNSLAVLDLSSNATLLSVDLSSQETAITSLDLTGRTEYPYSISLEAIAGTASGEFMSRASSLDVRDSDNAEVSCQEENSTLYFSSRPAKITYEYDTKASGDVSGYMPVSVTVSSDTFFPSLGLTVAPSTQSVYAGSRISNINITANNLLGALEWSFSVSGGTNLGLTRNGTAITGTIPSGTSPATYTVTITAHDNREDTATASATIRVNAVPVDTSGITGITITDPESRTVTLPSSGGSFTAKAEAQGTPRGSVSWSVTATGLEVSTPPDGSTAEITVTVPANTAYEAQDYTVTITAQDGRGEAFTDSISITVEAATPAVPGDDEPENPGTNTETDKYRFNMSSGMRNSILSAFPGISESDIHQLRDSEIITGEWTVSNNDLLELSGLNQRALYNMPVIRPENSGVYIVRLDLSDAEAGASIMLHGISGGDSSVNASSVEAIDYKFLDGNGNTITTVPANKVVYAAMNLTAGQETRGVVTTTSITSQGTVVPITEEEQEDLSTAIAEALNEAYKDQLDIPIEPEEIKYITEENITDAPEPTQDMINTAKEKNQEIVGKISTIQVEESGYYAMKVVLSDDLFEKIKDATLEEVAIYGFSADIDPDTGETSVSASMLYGLVNTWELLTLSGKKFDRFTFKEFLMVGFLNSSEPFTLYLARTLLGFMLGMPGGCNGLGISGMTLAVFVIILRRRR